MNVNVCELTVDDTHYIINKVPDSEGDHYIKEGIATVLDFRKFLVVAYKNTESHVHPGLLAIRQDNNGNDLIAIPLATNIMFYIRGLHYIDADFIKRHEQTDLHKLVKNKEGCYAVSAFEIIENL